MDDIKVELVVNGRRVSRTVPPRTSLADFLRDRVGCTGTHLGCEQGVCGSCSVLRDGRSVRSCLTLAAQAEGDEIDTVEGLVENSETGRRVADALATFGALQCGFCTPGFVVAISEMLAEGKRLSRNEIQTALSGNICRCTGYSSIIRAVEHLMAEPDE